MLIFKNGLHVPSMGHNLTPLFMLNEAEVKIHTSKMHIDDISPDDHSLCFKEEDFRMLLEFHVVFSYFPPANPSPSALHNTRIRMLYLTTVHRTHTIISVLNMKRAHCIMMGL